MGVSYETLKTAPFLHLLKYLEGARQRQEQAYQGSWEQARFVVHGFLQPHQKKGKRLKLTDVATFPWEENEKQPNTTAAAQSKLIEKLKREGKIKYGFSVKYQRQLEGGNH